MKVAILGGYGVFGSRLARLLIRDGHDVIIAGRNIATAQALANEIGASAIAVDRAGNLDPLFALSPDVVVDAAGPFHAYGDDPYRLVKACITHAVNYLDLADDADFCVGFSALDAKAKEANVFALSGISSVPALSSAVVASLAEGVDEINMIETAILPGNRAPRGQAVVDSILYQAGTDIDVTIDGKVEKVQSWSASKLFKLPGEHTRRGYMIRVPDQSIFPQYFNARTVTFYAGLEVGLMNHGLAAFAWVRNKIGFGIPSWLGKTVRWAATLLHGLGTDEGGMVVRVVCRESDAWQSRTWRLLVRKGEGPFVPAVSARTVLRNCDSIEFGARPGLAEFPLSDTEAAMSDLAAATERKTEDLVPLFAKALGPTFEKLPPAVKDSHESFGVRRLSGKSQISRGTGVWPKLLGLIFGFPKAAEEVPVTVVKTPTEDGEIWERRFGEQSFKSYLSIGPNGMQEGFGPFQFDLGLNVANDVLHFPVVSGRCFGIPMPKALLPQSDAHETEIDGVFHFDVALKAPITGQLVVHYRGELRPDQGASVAT